MGVISKTYLIKLYDESLVRFRIHQDELGCYEATVIDFAESKRHLMPLPLIDIVDGSTILRWINARIIPQNRRHAEKLLASVGLSAGDLIGLLDLSKGLSINDAFWIVEESDEASFESCNLFDNPTNSWIGIVAYTGDTSRAFDGGDSRTSCEWTSDGTFAKAWRNMNDELVLYKAGSELSFEPYSEFFASQLTQAMGIDAVHYDIDIWEDVLASTCPLMNTRDISFVPFRLGGGRLGYPYHAIVLRELGEHFFSPYKSMLVFDALIANGDRHAGNFGVLRNNHTGKLLGLAPVFDNNMAFFPQSKSVDSEDWLARASLMTPAGSNLTFEKQLELMMGEEQREQLARVAKFEFENHPEFPLDAGRLSALNVYLKSRIETLRNIATTPEKILNITLDKYYQQLMQDDRTIPLLELCSFDSGNG